MNVLHPHSRRRSQRGAASVETALSMILVLPIVLYAILLTDLLQHQLDLQESALTSPWDYAYLDYQGPQQPSNGFTVRPSTQANDVQRANQLMWCDHTSAYDAYDKATDCDSEAHHTERGARVCWLNDASQGGDKSVSQITCTSDDGVATGFPDPTAQIFHGQYTQGGMYSCRAQAYAMNFFVPQQLFGGDFSTVDLTDRQRYADNASVHGAGGSAVTGDVFVYPAEEYAVLTDTWALGPVQDELPGQMDGPLQERTERIYMMNLGYPTFAPTATQFLTQAQTSQLLLPVIPFTNDANPLRAHVAFRRFTGSGGPLNGVSQEGSNRSYYTTEWLDWNRNEYRRTWQARRNFYMGCTASETEC